MERGNIMALQPCKECGANVSSKAKTCPHCGALVPKKTSKIALILAGLFLLSIFIGVFNGEEEKSEPSPEMKKLQNQASIKVALSTILKDSDSAKYEFVSENCGTVNSKNSFGGYAGPKRFVSVGDTVNLESYSHNKQEMDALWNKQCK